MIRCGNKFFATKESNVVKPFIQDTPIFDNGIYAENAVINTLQQTYKEFENVASSDGSYISFKARVSGAFVSFYGSYHTQAHTSGDSKEIVLSSDIAPYLPTHQSVRTVGYYGKRAFVFVLTTDGKFSARNASDLDLETSEMTDIKFRFDFFRF